MTCKLYATTYHRDGTVTVWNVITQSWQRTRRPADVVLASMSDKERARVMRHCMISDEPTGNVCPNCTEVLGDDDSVCPCCGQ